MIGDDGAVKGPRWCEGPSYSGKDGHSKDLWRGEQWLLELRC